MTWEPRYEKDNGTDYCLDPDYRGDRLHPEHDYNYTNTITGYCFSDAHVDTSMGIN